MQPFFMPAGMLDNMPNFQRGIMAALGRFSTELMDQLGRTRGSSQTDRDLEQARGFLNEQPNIWIWQPSVSLMPSATSAQKYRAGREKLMAYNKRLARARRCSSAAPTICRRCSTASPTTMARTRR